MWKLQGGTDNVENWAYIENGFTKEQCQEVIKIGESLILSTATTFDKSGPDVRDSKVSWITPSPDTAPIFRQMTDIVNALNNKFFNFDLEGFAEGFQFTKYEAPAGKYTLHQDKSYGSQIRKLSVVVQLSDPSDYEGGELMLQTAAEPFSVKKQQGFVTVFPSYIVHGVTPVTKGTRYSLVAWITGPAFK